MVCQDICSKSKLSLLSIVINYAFVLNVIWYFYCFGVFLFGKSYLWEAYGLFPTIWMLLFFIYAIVLALLIPLGMYAVRNHNKAALMIYTLTLVALVFTQLFQSVILMDWVTSVEGNRELEIECLTDIYTKPLTSECNDILNADYMVDFWEVWRYLYEEAQVDPTVKLILATDIEESGTCCGYSKPYSCGKMGSTTDTSWGSSPTVTPCGNNSTFFISDHYCQLDMIVDEEVVDAGCPYELSVRGECEMWADEDVRGMHGCARELREWCESEVTPYSYWTSTLGILHIIPIFLSTCIFVRRKDNDILPPVVPYASERLYRKMARRRRHKKIKRPKKKRLERPVPGAGGIPNALSNEEPIPTDRSTGSTQETPKSNAYAALI
eukprot:TRINITY_DN8919_c0_g1_i1.p1 TRINITY_DN8919_c0_g1~~TRINITY_DN8919_c0_g1_i1.p1  ORF type:complete len:381 (+),score=59.79 TRINITY_DN8919_c0_g1_i1:145-1287(+)